MLKSFIRYLAIDDRKSSLCVFGKIDKFDKEDKRLIKHIENRTNVKLVQMPTDLELAKLINESTCFLYLSELEGFGKKSADNLLKEILDKKEISLERFIIALGIDEVGEETAILLSEAFEKIENIQKAKVEDFESIDGIGPIMAEKIINYFSDEHNKKIVENLLKEVKSLKHHLYSCDVKIKKKK